MNHGLPSTNDKSRIICLSGHRPQRLPGHGEPDAPETQDLIFILREKISEAVLQGRDTFINGFMAGFDILASAQVIALKERYPQIRLITIAPFSVRYYLKETCWTDVWIKRANDIWEQSDIAVSLSEHYRPGIYYERDRVMVEHSSELICYYDGGNGGTRYTVNRAAAKGLVIHNLYK